MIIARHFSTMNKRILSGLLLAGLFLSLHGLFLDADLPPWQISFYQPIDELYYTIPAFNIFHFSQFAYSPFAGETPEGSPANLLQTALTLLTLHAFGNNYYGLRMASVLAGFFSLLLLSTASLSALKKTFNAASCSTQAFYSVVIVFVIFSFDFSFNIGSRVAEPTIFSVLYTSALIYVLSQVEILDRRSAIKIGMLAGGAPFFGYLYLLFLIPASGIAVIVYASHEGWVKAVKSAAWFIVGTCAGVLLYMLVLAFLLDGEVGRYLSMITQSGGQRVAGVPLTLITLRGYVYDFLSGNIFRFNPALLLLSLFSFFAFTVGKEKKYPLVYLFVLSGLGFRFLQFLALSDHYHRKLLDLVPFLFLIVTFGVHAVLSRKFSSKAGLPLRLIASLLLAAVVFGVLISEHNAYKYFSTNILNIYGGEEISLGKTTAIFLFASLGLMGAALLLGLSKNSLVNGKIALTGLLVASVIPGMVFSYKFIYEDPQFQYRDAQIKLSPLIDNKILIGNYSHAFRLYNKSIPYFNVYTFVGSQDERTERTRALLSHERAWGSIGDINSIRAVEKVDSQNGTELRLTESGLIDIGDVENKKNRYVLVHK